MKIDHIYYISINSKKSERMEKILNKMFPKDDPESPLYSRFEGTNGHTINIKELYQKGYITQEGLRLCSSRAVYPKGTIGCYLSHIRLWDHIITTHKPTDNVLILEDDIEFVPRTKKEFNSLFSEITNPKYLPQQWEMIYFDYNNIYGKKYNKYYALPYNNAPYGHNANLSCYMIKHSTLLKMKKIVLPIGKLRNVLEIDVLLRNSMHLFNSLFYIPRLAKQLKHLGSCRVNIDKNVQ